jgi:hypothetical protein
MNARLEPPTDDLARRILATVPYQDRIPAGRLTARLGIMRGTVRGLPELHLYLTPDDQNLPAISLERLADWIERVIADPGLAREVRQATGAAPSYVDACIALRALVGHRLEQARHVLGVGDGAADRERRA